MAWAGGKEPLVVVCARRTRSQRGCRSPSHSLRRWSATRSVAGNITGLRARNGEVHVGTVALNAAWCVRSIWPCVLWRHFVHCRRGCGTTDGCRRSTLLVAVRGLGSCGARDPEMTIICEIIFLKSREILTHDGDMISVSRRLVLGCFWMVSSWPSRGLRYCICCGEGTGMRLASLLEDCCPFEKFGICRPPGNMPSTRNNVEICSDLHQSQFTAQNRKSRECFIRVTVYPGSSFFN